MSTPSPLIPQGTFQAQAAKGATNVRLAVATIVAIHVVFFGGLLLQGCKRETQTGQNAEAETNLAALDTNTSLALPPLGSNSLYYTSQSSLPTETGTGAVLPPQDSNPLLTSPQPAQSPETLWQATNLGSPLVSGAAQPGVSQPGTQFSAGMKEYTVARGDSFWKIAKAHGTTVNAIREANPNVDATRIQPGDKLMIPEGGAASAQSGSETGNGVSDGMKVYTVKSGDNLTRIANAHNITISQLRAANGLRTARINVGQKLKIPPAAQPADRTGNGAATQNGLQY